MRWCVLGEKKDMILFNALQKSISAGIGRYSFELSRHLYFLLSRDIKIVIRDEDLKDYSFADRNSLVVIKNIKNSRDRNIFEQIYLPKLINRNFKDFVIHYPDSMAPVFLNSNKIVITVHDLAFKSLSNAFVGKTVLWKNLITNLSVKKSRKIIAITNFSKSELRRHYKNVSTRIDVVYNGFNRLSNSDIKSENLSGDILNICSNKYILTVSTISPRKNIDTLIKAFDIIKNKHKNVNLVIVGSKGWLYSDIYDLVGSLNLENRVIFTGKVSEDELKYLYKNASIFVYPSIYEGFGLPPLEAMSCKLKTLVSDVECLREVLGNKCDYFEPKDYIQLSNMLDRFFSSNGYETSYDYEEILNRYSWEKCAKETFKTYEKILKGV